MRNIIGYIVVTTVIVAGLAGPVNPFPQWGMWAQFGAALGLVGFFMAETIEDFLAARRNRLINEGREKARQEAEEEARRVKARLKGSTLLPIPDLDRI